MTLNMLRRSLIIILTLLLAMGTALGMPVTAQCEASAACMAPQQTAHHGGQSPAGHCTCSSWPGHPASTCRVDQPLPAGSHRPAMRTADRHPDITGHTVTQDYGSAVEVSGNVSNLRLKSAVTTLHYPIYLQTLSLLC